MLLVLGKLVFRRSVCSKVSIDCLHLCLHLHLQYGLRTVLIELMVVMNVIGSEVEITPILASVLNCQVQYSNRF